MRWGFWAPGCSADSMVEDGNGGLLRALGGGVEGRLAKNSTTFPHILQLKTPPGLEAGPYCLHPISPDLFCFLKLATLTWDGNGGGGRGNPYQKPRCGGASKALSAPIKYCSGTRWD